MNWRRGEEHESMLSVYVPGTDIRATFHVQPHNRLEVEREMVERFNVWPHPECGAEDEPYRAERYAAMYQGCASECGGQEP